VPQDYLEAARIPLVLRPSAFEANAQDVAGLYDAVTAQNGRYREIRLPATVIAGDADRIVYTDIHSRSFAREVPGTKLMILPGMGHMPHYAAQDVIVAEIEALAARLGGAIESRAAAP
jgi:pimeloyl-ACP methyl ester carboxylesterase